MMGLRCEAPSGQIGEGDTNRGWQHCGGVRTTGRSWVEDNRTSLLCTDRGWRYNGVAGDGVAMGMSRVEDNGTMEGDGRAMESGGLVVVTIPSDSRAMGWNPSRAVNLDHLNWIKFQVSIPWWAKRVELHNPIDFSPIREKQTSPYDFSY
jgi:hypothetical protein